ncbi:MAG TPA: hypothetical protein VIY48_16820 [Candidatus Paceibacterota bacterium]
MTIPHAITLKEPSCSMHGCCASILGLTVMAALLDWYGTCYAYLKGFHGTSNQLKRSTDTMPAYEA